MIDKLPDDTTVGLLGRTLTRSSIDGAVIASNVGNVDTPGYRALRAEFDAGLSLALNGQVPEDLVRLEEAPITRMRPDGNTVDIDVEMTRLAGATGRFQTAAQLIRKRFALFRYAMTDGRG